MAEVTNELLYEVLKSLQTRMSNFEEGLREIRGEMRAFRGNLLANNSRLDAVQIDLGNIYETLTGIDTRISRIERRLDIIDTPVP
jgi:hypothetical protein